MKYTKEEFQEILEELNIKYKYQKMRDGISDLFLFTIVIMDKEITGGMLISSEHGHFIVLVPNFYKLGQDISDILLKINYINSELKYGRIYMEESKKTISFRINQKLHDVEKEDVGEYIAETAFVINAVFEDENK